MNELDGIGIYGMVFHYSFIFALMGGAALVFIYLWRKGRLDMDEDPKMQMLERDESILIRHEEKDGGKRS